MVDPFEEFLALENGIEAAMRKSMNVPEHVYRDIPWCAVKYWNELINTIGDDNIKVIAMSQMARGPDKEICRRGQFMISPQGMANLGAYIAKNKKEAEAKEAKSNSIGGSFPDIPKKSRPK